MTLSAMHKTRSNRKLTQFAVDHVLQYVNVPLLIARTQTFINTSVVIHDDMSLSVDVFDNRLLHITRDSNDNSIDSVYVFSGGRYDNDGNPSDLTRERLNGLLAALGDAKVIPKRVCVFMDFDYGMCYLGSGEQKIAFNRDYTNIVHIKASPNVFVFEGYCRFLPVA